MNTQIDQSLTVRSARAEDGAALWELVKRSGTLDLNSAYAYMLLCDEFGDTCAVAEHDGEAVGFVTAFRRPRSPGTLFVWQVGVDASMRGRGLASRMLQWLLESAACAGVTHVEATISPSNAASRALFGSLAKRHKAPHRVDPGYGPELFPGGGHEREERHRIGPLKGAGQ